MDAQKQIEVIQKHADLETAAYFAFCDRVITLSTGALALSITFRSSFSATSPVSVCLLKLSWICFTIAILTALINHIGRMCAHRSIKLQAIANPDGALVSKVARVFNVTRWTMYVSFFLAIASLAAFAFVNLK